uniref:G-protein coupled receptors family 3 profile domain-containing protein n=1 Tax=Denticeps clupeoides TaxID=299321 RepID=A0AAY4DQ05_9TELE
MWISQAPALALLLIHWVFGQKPPVSETGSVICKLQGTSAQPALSKQGDFLIGGIFAFHYDFILEQNYTRHPLPLQCTGRLYSRELRFARAMEFAIQEINNRLDILPNVTLGYQIYDSCGTLPMAVKVAFQFANGLDPGFIIDPSCQAVAKVAAVIGDSNSTPSIGIARLLGLFRVPQVSHFATCACLSDKRQYPAFFRTIPSDHYQAAALAQLVKHFGWTWIGAIRSDSDYGNNGMASFLKAAQKEGICVEYSVAFSSSNPHSKVERVAEIIRSSTSKTIVAFTNAIDIRILMEELTKKTTPLFQWIGCEAWLTDPEVLKFGELAGALGFGIERSIIPRFRELAQHHSNLDTGKGLKICTGTENLSAVNVPYTDTSQLRISNMVYKAMYAIAHAIHGTRWKLFTFIYLNFTTNGYPVGFDSNGDPVPTYELVNWQESEDGTLHFVTVGRYDASKPKDQQFSMSRNIKVPVSVCSVSCHPGTRKAAQKGRPVCCYDCLPCGEGEISNETDCISCPDESWPNSQRDECLPKLVEFLSLDEVLGIILAVCSIAGACMVAAVAVIFYRHRTSPIVRANNSELSFLLLFSLTLCFLCSLTFIGQPSDWSCMLRHTAFGITFVLCISCVLGKTIVVLTAFKATIPGNSIMKWFGPPQQRMTVVCFTSVQALICTLWLVLSPPFPIKNMSLYKERIILECNLGSAGAFWAVLGYIGLLAFLCFVLAFLARKLPDNFNEAKFITFSMLIFCAVWITFIPTYVSSPGKFTVAVEIFAILASSFGLMACIFVPKCFIIIFRPEQNTKKHLMGKDPGSNPAYYHCVPEQDT